MRDRQSNDGVTSALVARLADLGSRSEVVVWEGRGITGAELEVMVAGYARWLIDTFAPRPGDRIAVRSELSPMTLVMLVAHLRLGLVHVPVPPRYTPDEVAHIVDDCGASHVLDPAAVGSLAGEPVAWPTVPASALAWIVYTSGTTGRPKGVMMSHRALAANLLAVTGLWEVDKRDRVIATLPLFHVHGLGLVALGSLLVGATIILKIKFSASDVVDDVARGATVFMGVPTMYHLLLDHLEAHPEAGPVLGHARLFTAGSAALSAASFEAFRRHTGHNILERYGMTETGFTLSNPLHGERRPGCVGMPVPGVLVRLVNESGHEVAPGEPGEIEVGGDSLMDGYWGRPEATAAAFGNGWFKTGDTAVMDDGYVRIVGRTSTDIIKTGGFKVGAREVEDVVLASGLVTECAVLGANDPKWGEVVLCVFVPRAGAADEVVTQLAAHCASSLVDYKRPRRYRVVDALPRNAMGKVQKTALKDPS